MALLGSKNNVEITVTTEARGKGIEETQKKLDGLKGSLQRIGEVAAGVGLANLGERILGGLKSFLSDASQSAIEFEKSMTTLDIISSRFGVSGDEAKKTAERLGKELRIGVGPAAESLQNLLKSGLNLEQAADLLKRFTNEAITGKSPSISLAQAVQNLSFAYATNNSALGNLSGISENFKDIIERGREALIKKGVAVEKITDDMAKYTGMIQLTNLTMGSAERFTGSLIDKQAELGIKLQEIKQIVGVELNKAFASLLGVVLDTGIFDKIKQKLQEVIPEIKKQLEPVIQFLQKHKDVVLFFFGTLIAVTAVGSVLLLAWSFSVLVAKVAVIGAVFAAISAIVTGLVLAWQNNFLNIRGVAQGVADFFQNSFLPAVSSAIQTFSTNLHNFVAFFVNIFAIVKFILFEAIEFFSKMFVQRFQVELSIVQDALEFFKHAFSMVWDGIKYVVEEAGKFIFSVIKSVAQGVINLVNGVIRAVNAVGEKIPGFMKFKEVDISISTPDLPKIQPISVSAPYVPNRSFANMSPLNFTPAAGQQTVVKNITQNNYNYTPVDVNQSFRNLSFAVR